VIKLLEMINRRRKFIPLSRIKRLIRLQFIWYFFEPNKSNTPAHEFNNLGVLGNRLKLMVSVLATFASELSWADIFYFQWFNWDKGLTVQKWSSNPILRAGNKPICIFEKYSPIWRWEKSVGISRALAERRFIRALGYTTADQYFRSQSKKGGKRIAYYSSLSTAQKSLRKFRGLASFILDYCADWHDSLPTRRVTVLRKMRFFGIGWENNQLFAAKNHRSNPEKARGAEGFERGKMTAMKYGIIFC